MHIMLQSERLAAFFYHLGCILQKYRPLKRKTFFNFLLSISLSTAHSKKYLTALIWGVLPLDFLVWKNFWIHKCTTQLALFKRGERSQYVWDRPSVSLAFKSRHGWFTNSCLEPYLVQNILFSEITYLLSFNCYGIFSGIPGDNNQYHTQKSSTLCPALAVSRAVLHRSPLRGHLLEEFSTFISTFLFSNFLVINMQNLK